MASQTRPSTVAMYGASPHTHERRHSAWSRYRDFVRANGASLGLLEDLVNQWIFWIPQSSHDETNDNRWREILYGLLSLHHMAADLAWASDHDELPELFGTTVEVQLGRRAPLSPTSLRVALSIIHNLMPTILQLVPQRNQRPRVRLWLEQIKFSLRLLLMGSYWLQLIDNQQLEYCGLVMRGGMMNPLATLSNGKALIMSVEQERARRNRQEYTGRRTGRTVVKATALNKRSNSIAPLILGELLHAYRPLHWAWVETMRLPSFAHLTHTLCIDVISLLLLNRYSDSALNAQELKRRKLNLLLYLMRTPLFDKFTAPTASAALRVVAKIPLLGKLLQSYFWDWLLYWKHPFSTEFD